MNPPPTLKVVPPDPVVDALGVWLRRQLHLRGVFTATSPPDEDERGKYRALAGYITSVVGHDLAARLADMPQDPMAGAQ